MNLLVANAKAEKNKMIMKKNYFKPEVELVDVRIDSYILNDSSYGGNVTPGEGPGNSGFGAKESRGEWGNVWAN